MRACSDLPGAEANNPNTRAAAQGGANHSISTNRPVGIPCPLQMKLPAGRLHNPGAELNSCVGYLINSNFFTSLNNPALIL